MLAANVCASDYLAENRQPMLYRVHEGPTPEKLAALREFLGGFVRYRMRTGMQEIVVDVPHRRDGAAHEVGAQVGLVIDPRQIAVLR